MKKTTYTLLAFGTVALAAASLLSSCIKENPDSPGWEYFPDMYRSPSLETNMASGHDSVLVNGVWMKDTIVMANMMPPAGTIPRGFTPFPYENTPAGDSLASHFWKSPYTTTDELEAEGKFLYERFCIYCHGAAGDGNGKLVESGKYASTPPNYAKVYADGKLTDGHIYHVITYGKNVMGSHASQLTPEERWKVVAYVERLGQGGKPYSERMKAMAAAPAADSTAAKKPAQETK